MGGVAGATTGLALLLAAGMAWAGGVLGREENRGLSPIIPRSFLSLYNLTIGDGDTSNQNGTWEEIVIASGSADADKTKIRQALFGGGTQATSAIQHIYLGDAPPKGSNANADRNAWPRSWAVLNALGVPGSTYDGHEHHYHVDFRTPTRVPVKPATQSLTAEGDAGTLDSGMCVPEIMQLLAKETAQELGLMGNDMDMYYIDQLDAAKTPVVLVAQAPVSGRERVMGMCVPVEMTQKDWLGMMTFDPASDAAQYMEFFAKQPLTSFLPFDSIRITQQPVHGTLTREKNAVGRDIYVYRPNIGYLGKDRIEAVVPVGNDTVRIIYNLVVQPDPIEREDFDRQKYCPMTEWKISSYFKTSTLDNATLQSLLTQSGLDGSAVTLQVSDLTGSAVGSTSGTTITLDTDAAGHGWYLDYTPYLNEEFLPTSNPYEWIAKEGTAAYGKMDLLSVLWHEVGHALGLNHSADSHDLMAATLAPGVRRLPDADTLAEFRRMLGYSLAADSNLPTTPDIPQPDGPLPPNNGRNSNVRVARARITREGTFVIGEDGVEREQTAFQSAANPTLTDPRLETGSGWEMTGNVSLGNGAAILSESSTSQTRLNQVFIVGEHDRYLTFTLAGIALDDVTNAPDDAFEAALLDANSGASLLAGTGLTRNDAFLNLQADGSERAGQGVTSTLNADGSRTYRIDLAGIPAGTAVNLSFDLIGFDSATSQITVRDIRLGVPETRDDAVTTLEDTPTDIAVTANDLDADQPGFAPVVVIGPEHGTVTLNETGGFTYTPDADWHGEDSFTYKLSDGTVDSNLATVSLTVTAVNDAPTAGDQTLTTLEDTALTLDLLANASDIDSPTIAPVVVSGPQHGTLTQNPDGGFSYTPEADFNGTDRIEYKVGDGETAVETVTRRAA